MMRYSFSGHESFPCKSMWLKKGEALFDKFYRADKSRSSDTGGTGLGLAIAKEIVVLHGGTISAASKNHVVTFTISLPLAH